MWISPPPQSKSAHWCSGASAHPLSVAARTVSRIASVLLSLSKEHKLTISATSSDHPKLTTGGSVSNHFFGRAVDIAAIARGRAGSIRSVGIRIWW